MTAIMIAQIYVWRNKAYVPAHGRLVGGGPFVIIEPVVIADLNKDAIVQAVKSALRVGHPAVPAMTGKELDRRPSPLLAATGTRSWSEFQRTASLYTVEWGPAGVFLEFGRRAPEGGWLFDPERRRIFEPEVKIEDIVEVILRDMEAAPPSKNKPVWKPD